MARRRRGAARSVLAPGLVGRGVRRGALPRTAPHVHSAAWTPYVKRPSAREVSCVGCPLAKLARWAAPSTAAKRALGSLANDQSARTRAPLNETTCAEPFPWHRAHSAMRRLLIMLLLATTNAQTDAPTPRPQTPPTDTPRPTPSPSPRPRNWTPSPTRSPKPTLPPTLSFSPTFAPSPAPSVSPSAAPSPHPTPQPQTAAPTQKPIPEKFPFYFTVAGVEVMKTQITFLNSLCACVFVGGTLRHLYDSLWRPKMSLVEGGLRSNRRF